MKAQRNLDGILNRTRKPRLQERGLPYFTVVTPKPGLCECGHPKHEGQCLGTAQFTGYQCICKGYREAQARVA